VVLPGAPITLTVNVDTTGIDPLATPYSGKVVVTASGVPSANKATNVTVGLLVNALTPTITSLWPTAALAGSGATTITIRGTGFYKGTTVKASGASTPLKTTFLSPTVLLADVPASLTATAEHLEGDRAVSLHQDAGVVPGGETILGEADREFAQGQIVQVVNALRVTARGAFQLCFFRCGLDLGVGNGASGRVDHRSGDGTEGLLCLHCLCL